MARRRKLDPRLRKPSLRISSILAWADAHRRRTGRWPTMESGPVRDAAWEKWGSINAALRTGNRGLPGGSTLARLLAEQRGHRNRLALPRLSARQILAWADAHHKRTGSWPTAGSGDVHGATGEVWVNINAALHLGSRGLPGGATLARLLAEERGRRNPMALPPLTVKQILAWADAEHRRTGVWPTGRGGAIRGAPGETWSGIDHALYHGTRGLPWSRSGGSLARLLAEHRGRRHLGELPKLTEQHILKWADRHHRLTGRWPTLKSGPIKGAPGERWSAVHTNLQQGQRGLPGGSSLARLLERGRGVRNLKHLRPLRINAILAWADEHRRRTGRWPTHKSGPIVDAPGEKWGSVDQLRRIGGRGLPGGSSVVRLLVEHRGARNTRYPPKLTLGQILAWADAHHHRTGRWPMTVSGPLRESPGETWAKLNEPLRKGHRGLPSPPRARSLTMLLSGRARPGPPNGPRG